MIERLRNISVEDRLVAIIAAICFVISSAGFYFSYNYDMRLLISFKLFASVLFFIIFIISLSGHGTLANIMIRTQIMIGSTFTTLCYGWGFGYEIYLLGLLCVMFLDLKNSSAFTYISFIFSAGVYLALFFVVGKGGFVLYEEAARNLSHLKSLSLVINLAVTITSVGVYQMYFNTSNFNEFVKIDDQKHYYENLADYDSLTSLLNRQSFYRIVVDRLKTEPINQTGMLMVDIDFFKKINDTHGHDVGDEVLKGIASVIASLPRSCMCARWGGEEFVVLVRGADMAMLEKYAKILHNRINASEFGSKRIKASVSIGGIYTNCQVYSRLCIDNMLRYADENLYFCKNNGRNMIKITKY